MRTPRPLLLLLACLVVPASLIAQESSSSPSSTTPGPQDSQAASLLRQSIAAMTGGAPITDVTMTGTATLTIGSDAESGTIVLVATASGQSRVTLDLPSGSRSDFRDYSTATHTGTFAGPDGVSHSVPTPLLAAPHPAWFFPAFVMASATSPSSSYASSLVGRETRNGVMAEHATIWPRDDVSTITVAGSVQHTHQHDFYLDPSSMLPVSIAASLPNFNGDRSIPMWGNAFPRYIPEEFRFSDYRLVQGMAVAFHIQVYVDQKISMDIRLANVAINTGASIATAN
jgi:hypothetical protein